MAEHAKESGHWYDREGNPRYTIIGKNGKERPTTLRDAKKEKLLPSVTSIIRCAAAPGLERWKSEQVLMAALTTDRLPNESEQEYIDRIIKDSQEQALKARERGTQIHAWVQGGFENELITGEAYQYYLSASQTILNNCGDFEWYCETPFSTERYGGKIDLINEKYIIDIKTTDKPISDLKLWESHIMQLAAYNYDKNKECGILFINSNEPKSKLVWATEDEISKGWNCFSALLDFFYAKTGLGG